MHTSLIQNTSFASKYPEKNGYFRSVFTPLACVLTMFAFFLKHCESSRCSQHGARLGISGPVVALWQPILAYAGCQFTVCCVIQHFSKLSSCNNSIHVASPLQWWSSFIRGFLMRGEGAYPISITGMEVAEKMEVSHLPYGKALLKLQRRHNVDKSSDSSTYGTN